VDFVIAAHASHDADWPREQGKNRVAKSRTSFATGVSGNPGGRPRAALDVQELARAATPAAIAALVAALANPRERVSAAVALLDRAWGKPTLPLAGDAAAAPIAYSFRWADATTQSGPEPEAIDDASDADDVEELFAAPPC
jgi:hypothetical protein